MQRLAGCKPVRRQQRKQVGHQRGNEGGAVGGGVVRLVLYGQELALPKDVLFEHPGGPDMIYALAGRDCTEEFEARAVDGLRHVHGGGSV